MGGAVSRLRSTAGYSEAPTDSSADASFGSSSVSREYYSSPSGATASSSRRSSSRSPDPANSREATTTTPRQPQTLLGAPAADAPRRKVNALSLAWLAYMCICGGPYGIEVAVMAGGVLWVLLAVAILPFVWSIPQAMMTTELSTMLDDNGGYIIWVRRGLGNFWGWVSSYNSITSNFVDLPLYGLLLGSYTATFVQLMFDYEMTGWQQYCVMFVSLLLCAVNNIAGAKEVSAVAGLIVIIVVAPFFVEPWIVLPKMSPHQWVTPASQPDMAVFMSTMIWSFQGWDSLGCLAGEVKNGRYAYPVGIGLAIVWTSVTYALPILVAIAVHPDMSTWADGELESAAFAIGKWLGVWVMFGAILSNVGTMNVMLCTGSRALWAMGRRKMLPGVLGYESPKYNTPIVAIIVQSAATAALYFFPFDALVLYDMLFNNLSLVLETVSFLALKYWDPHAPRPFAVPGGRFGAWCVVLPKLAVIVWSLATAGTTPLLILGGSQFVFALTYFVRYRLFPDPTADKMDAIITPTTAPMMVSLDNQDGVTDNQL